jgi:hypothetical protein
MFGDPRTRGWTTIIFGGVQILAGRGVPAGNQAARWFAVAVVGLNALDQMLPAHPAQRPRSPPVHRGVGSVRT